MLICLFTDSGTLVTSCRRLGGDFAFAQDFPCNPGHTFQITYIDVVKRREWRRSDPQLLATGGKGTKILILPTLVIP